MQTVEVDIGNVFLEGQALNGIILCNQVEDVRIK